MSRLLRSRALGVAVGSCLLVGCGPVQYISVVSFHASQALAEADREEAGQVAPYELTMAREYLRKAQEEGAESSFENAAEYGRRCEAMAVKARELAQAARAAATTRGGPRTPLAPTEPTERQR